MRKYEEPTLEVQKFSIEDIITETIQDPNPNAVIMPDIDTD